MAGGYPSPVVLESARDVEVPGASNKGIQVDAGLWWMSTDGATLFVTSQKLADASTPGLAEGMSRIDVGPVPRLVRKTGGDLGIRNLNAGVVFLILVKAEEGTCACGRSH